MNEKHLHCRSDGTACVSEDAVTAVDDVAVLPYEDGMQVIVRAELANGVRRCTTVTVEGLAEGETRAIVNLDAAGDGARVVDCAVKGGFGDRARSPNTPENENGGFGETARPSEGRARSPSASNDGDDGTPSELWASGIKDVPSALPSGGVAFLVMQKHWYEEIECGMKDVEQRKQCQKYRKMFIDHHPVAVKLQCGYTNRQMTWQIADVEDCEGDGIFIHLGKRIM